MIKGSWSQNSASASLKSLDFTLLIMTGGKSFRKALAAMFTFKSIAGWWVRKVNQYDSNTLHDAS